MSGAALFGAAYCGEPPEPGALAMRFNLDPVLIAALLAVALLHIAANRRDGRPVGVTAAGWAIAAAAFISPLCALSVSLFSARVGQHMILVLVAAPLISAAVPPWRWLTAPSALWGAGAAFFAFLWFWHMPAPYALTFTSTAIYWTMHLTLFGSGIALWAVLLRQHSVLALAAGTFASVQMGLLGAVICFAGWPMYRPHYFTTQAWGLSPLADQQLGGVLMWVPGCLFFLWVAMRTLAAIWSRLEAESA